MSSAMVSFFGLTVLTVLLAGYLGQKYLPPPTPKVVGIDLGTTYSCIGVYHAVTGEVRVIEDEDQHKCIPSIVAFSKDDILVGYKAQERAELWPRQTIYDAKRFIGREMSAEELEAEAGRYPFKVSLRELGSETSPVTFDLEDGTYVTPVDIGSHIIKKLRDTAIRNLTVPVKRAVMAVPAEFDQKQRKETERAAKLAGIEVLRIINEPTAAALAYGLHNKSGVDSVLVVDLGGGTLDVSLLKIQGGMFLTVAMAGNSHLGGQDFTQRLTSHLLKQIQKDTGQLLTTPEDLQTLRTQAEIAKLDLTYKNQTLVNLTMSPDKPGRRPRPWTHTLTRDIFEELNQDLFQKVLEPIERILEARDLTAEDVGEVVLVGGSTRIPRIRTILRTFFSKEVNTAIDPELAVTYGLAIQAGILAGMWPLTVSAIELPTTVSKIKLH